MTPVVGNKFQVSNGEEVFIVSIIHKTCSFRAWDLYGIPCTHGIACINFMKHDLLEYMDPYYSKNLYMSAERSVEVVYSDASIVAASAAKTIQNECQSSQPNGSQAPRPTNAYEEFYHESTSMQKLSVRRSNA
ncbi:hypothetical protein GH714_021157 [Hevea brasiliensis]|uniref:SWIM-type domain-containing protein n=1 Tax=Hevea brasiliensis TaxID=3981 RepID=A0A6A6LE67_HEVBR|nr:hypothetical protein GH714_021157 [Hevea brasiliensis]